MTVIMVIFVIIFLLIMAFLIYGAVLSQKSDKKLREEGFCPNIKIGRLEIDEINKLWTLSGIGIAFRFDEIVDCAVIEDGISYKPDHGVLRAVVGGYLFGAVGAVVGASTASTSEYVNSMEVAIWKKDSFQNRPLKISILNSKTSKNSSLYKMSKETAESIVNIIDTYSRFSERKNSDLNRVTLTEHNQISTADDLEKYKKLLDEGAITQEEYDTIKAKLISKI